MVKLLYGTTNKAKLEVMENATKDLDIEIISLNEIEGELPKIEENGKTPLENAEIKARAYYEAFQMPVFSCDSGLYFDELEDEEQPGIHVRRVGGRELSDEEIRFYIENYKVLDKAGSYGIQEFAGVFVSSIEGDYFNIVGLPVCRLYTLINEEFGDEL